MNAKIIENGEEMTISKDETKILIKEKLIYKCEECENDIYHIVGDKSYKEIDKILKPYQTIFDLLKALNDAKGQISYLRTKLTPRQYKFTTPTSEAVNQVINQAIKTANP